MHCIDHPSVGLTLRAPGCLRNSMNLGNNFHLLLFLLHCHPCLFSLHSLIHWYLYICLFIQQPHSFYSRSLLISVSSFSKLNTYLVSAWVTISKFINFSSNFSFDLYYLLAHSLLNLHVPDAWFLKILGCLLGQLLMLLHVSRYSNSSGDGSRIKIVQEIRLIPN